MLKNCSCLLLVSESDPEGSRLVPKGEDVKVGPVAQWLELTTHNR